MPETVLRNKAGYTMDGLVWFMTEVALGEDKKTHATFTWEPEDAMSFVSSIMTAAEEAMKIKQGLIKDGGNGNGVDKAGV